MDKISICRRIEIDYGHTLPNHYSFCNQIHGHRAYIDAYLTGDVNTVSGSSSEGMVLDFKIVKEMMMKYIHDILDHGFAVWVNDIDDRSFIEKRNKKFIITDEPPTAEYLCKWAFFQIADKMPSGIILEKIVWYETPNSFAEFKRC